MKMKIVRQVRGAPARHHLFALGGRSRIVTTRRVSANLPRQSHIISIVESLLWSAYPQITAQLPTKNARTKSMVVPPRLLHLLETCVCTLSFFFAS